MYQCPEKNMTDCKFVQICLFCFKRDKEIFTLKWPWLIFFYEIKNGNKQKKLKNNWLYSLEICPLFVIVDDLCSFRCVES